MFKERIKFVAASIYRPFIGSGRRVVLCYHSLKADAVMNFTEQMKYLAAHCEIVKPSEILSAGPQDKPVVAVTFDDAFVSFYENAVPVLKTFNIPAGVFVPTGYIGRPCGWKMPVGHSDREETVADSGQLTAMEKDGIEVFSHTMTHPSLTALSSAKLKEELAGSKAALEQILGHSVGAISYPHGRYNENVINAAQESGYRLGFTIEPQCVDELTNPYAIGRFVVSPKEPLSRFKLKACGAYAAENILRNLKRRMK